MHDGQSSDFVDYLRSAIRSAGFSTPTQFARKADLDPSVVLRWLGGTQRPTIRSLERVAPILGRSTSEMVRAAYPDRLGQDDTNPAPMHELGYEVGRLLGADSPIAPEDREFLTRVLNTVLEPYRQDNRPRRGRRAAAPSPATSGSAGPAQRERRAGNADAGPAGGTTAPAEPADPAGESIAPVPRAR